MIFWGYKGIIVEVVDVVSKCSLSFKWVCVKVFVKLFTLVPI